MLHARRLLSPGLLIAAIVLSSSTGNAQRPHPRGQQQTTAVEQAAPDKGRKPTQRQLENAEARIAAATRILNRLTTEAKALGRADGWRQASLESLLALPLDRLQRVEQSAFSVDALATSLMEAASDPNVLGSDTEDLVYKPIVPCRYVDTRNVAGKIVGGVPRGYDIGNAGNVYGGQGTCVPNTMFGPPQDDIAALAMNVGITEPNGAPGFLAVKPTLAAPVTSFMNWFAAGVHVQLANAGIVTLDQNVGTAEEFFIQTSETTHVTVDLFGAFIAPQATPLQRVLKVANVSVPNNTTGFLTTPGCDAGYVLTGGGCSTSLDEHHLEGSEPGASSWSCISRNHSGFTSNLSATAICARVPGR